MSEMIDFLSPRLVGERFTGHAIPLEVLKDLAVLEELVTETAKYLYLKENPERQRVPKGFTDGISIKITDIGEGSAIPKLVLCMTTLLGTGLISPVNQEYFEKARENIICAIDAADTTRENIIKHLPDSLLVYFDRLGRSLQDDECIEFRPSNPEKPGRLNKLTRKKLILASSQMQEFTDEAEIKGLIPEADQEKNSFTINVLPDGAKITAPLDINFREEILEAFNKYKDKQKICIKGIGLYNRAGKLIKLESIERVTFVDKLDISERLADLGNLKAGWLDGKGSALNKTDLKWLDESFVRYYGDSLPLPHIYPTAEGNIQAEWSIKDWEISLEINLSQKRGEYQAVEISSGTEKTESYDLTNMNSWIQLGKDISALIGGAV